MDEIVNRDYPSPHATQRVSRNTPATSTVTLGMFISKFQGTKKVRSSIFRPAPGPRASREVEDLTFFVPWDFDMNMPKVTVDVAGVFLDTLWVA